MIEVLIAISLIVVGVAALSGSIVSGSRLSTNRKETGIASEAIRRTLEQIQGEAFSDVFARYNTDPGDDPGGAGTAPGANFAVRGLNPQPGDADGFVGRITFPQVDQGSVAMLREDVVDANWGMPRDLNADGLAPDADDHSGDYVLLPIRITLDWRGTAGDRTVVFETLMTPR